jgi:hypothetical protein
MLASLNQNSYIMGWANSMHNKPSNSYQFFVENLEETETYFCGVIHN